MTIFEFQTDLIFPVHAVPKAGPLPAHAERLSVRTGDGETLEGIHIPSEVPGRSKTLILGFGGNAWNGQDVAEYLHQIYPSHDVIAFHYRGYRPSTGSPSGEALIADAPLVYDAAVSEVKPGRVVGVGFSIGTGVVAQLSAKRKLDGVILVTPFDSLKALAQSLYPWIPIGPFFSHEIDAAGPLQQSHVPVAIIAAENDEIVRGARTDALRHVLMKLVYDRTIAGAGHNDIYGRSDFQDAMHEALDRLKA
jgi:pimeloyl-ACP methyl ester carboxylesterase